MHATENACEHRWTDRVVLIQFDGFAICARREGGRLRARRREGAFEARARRERARARARRRRRRRRHTGRARRAPPQAPGGTRQGGGAGRPRSLRLPLAGAARPRRACAPALPHPPTTHAHTYTPKHTHHTTSPAPRGLRELGRGAAACPARAARLARRSPVARVARAAVVPAPALLTMRAPLPTRARLPLACPAPRIALITTPMRRQPPSPRIPTP